MRIGITYDLKAKEPAQLGLPAQRHVILYQHAIVQRRHVRG